MSRAGSIGQSVTKALRKTRLCRAAAAQPASPRAGRAWPHASGLPLLGNTISMTGDVRAYLTEQYLQLGPVFQVRAFQHTFTVLAGPEANLFLIREGKTHLRSLESWTEFNSELGATRSIVSMDGQEHIRLRRTLRDGYSRSYIEKTPRSRRRHCRARNRIVAAGRAAPRFVHASTHYHGSTGRVGRQYFSRVNTWTTSSC